MFIQTTNVEIDTENSMTYGKIYTTAGSYSGVNVKGQIPPMILDYKCDENIPIQAVNLYVDILHQTVNILVDNKCPTGIHVGGVIVTSDGCDCVVSSFLQREDRCITYKRAFSSSFATSYNTTQSSITCDGGASAFSDDYLRDFEN